MSDLTDKFKNRPGKLILSPDELTSKQLSQPVIDDIMTNKAAVELDMKRAIEEAIRLGTEIAKQLEKLKPVTRALIVKTLFEHSMQQDKKVMRALKDMGI